MTKLKVAQEHGTWYYEKVKPNAHNDYDESVWVLYDENQQLYSEYGFYWELKEWVEQNGKEIKLRG